MYSLYALITFTVMISLMYFYPCSIRILEVLFVEDCMLCTGDDMGCIRAAQNISHCVDILFYPNLITDSILGHKHVMGVYFEEFSEGHEICN